MKKQNNLMKIVAASSIFILPIEGYAACTHDNANSGSSSTRESIRQSILVSQEPERTSATRKASMITAATPVSDSGVASTASITEYRRTDGTLVSLAGALTNYASSVGNVIFDRTTDDVQKKGVLPDTCMDDNGTFQSVNYQLGSNVTAAHSYSISLTGNPGEAEKMTQTVGDGTYTSTSVNTADGLVITDKYSYNNNNPLFTIRGENSGTNTDAGKNIYVSNQDNNTLRVELSNNIELTNDASLKVNDIQINADGVDLANKKITSVANGTVDANSQDAVNGSQLFALQSIVNSLSTSTGGNAVNTKVVAGDNEANIVVNEEASTDGSKTYKLTLNKDLKLATGGSVSIGDKTYITEQGLNANGNKITNVENGDISATSKDAVNGSQLNETNVKVNKNAENITTLQETVSKGLNFVDETGKSVNKQLGEALTVKGDSKNTTVKYDENNNMVVGLNKDITVNSVSSSSGDNAYNLSDDGLKFGEKAYVTKNGLNANDVKVTNVAKGDISQTSTDAINGSQLYETNQNVAINTQNINKGLNFADNNGNVINKQLGTTTPIVGKTVNGHTNIISEVNSTTGGVEFSLNNDLKVGTIVTNEGDVTVNNDGLSVKNGPSVTKKGMDAGNKVIKNVADGEISETSTEAVNGSQIYNIASYLNNKIDNSTNAQITNRVSKTEGDIVQIKNRVNNLENKVDNINKKRKAGSASAMATAGLLQAHKPGQSGVTAAVGQYQGETAVAVGYSRLSDNGKYGVKASFNTNTQKELGGSLGVGYFW